MPETIIEHIVLSGGGFAGLLELGALQYLSEHDFFDLKNIKSIYGTSIGAILGAVLALKLDWNIVINYFTERPFYKLQSFQITPDKFLDFYTTSGIFNHLIIHDILGYIFEYRDLSSNITLKELYDKTDVSLYIYATKIQGYELIEFSHHSHPNMKLFDAIYMSCSIISLMIPLVKDEITYMDGGYINNYPIEPCINRVENPDSILSISFGRTFDNYSSNKTNNIVNTIMTFTMEMMKKSYIEPITTIKNQINMNIELNDVISPELFYGVKEKKHSIQKGREYAKLFIMYRNQLQ